MSAKRFIEDQYLCGPGPYSAINPNDGWLGSYPYRGTSGDRANWGPESTFGMGAMPVTVAIARPVKNAATGFPGLFAWIAANHPKLYNYIRVSIPDMDVEGVRSGASQLGGDDTLDFVTTTAQYMPVSAASEGITNDKPMFTSNWAEQIASFITSAGSAILPLAQQNKLLAVNVDRAKRGLPPVNIASYESATSGINVGLNRATQSTLMYIAGGLAVVYLASKVLSRR